MREEAAVMRARIRRRGGDEMWTAGAKCLGRRVREKEREASRRREKKKRMEKGCMETNEVYKKMCITIKQKTIR